MWKPCLPEKTTSNLVVATHSIEESKADLLRVLEASLADSLLGGSMWVRNVIEVMIHINHVFPADGLGVVGLRLLSDSFGHEPVECAHVEVHRREPDRVPL